MRKAIIVLLCLSITLFSMAQVNEKAEKIFKKAEKTLEKEKYDEAKSLLEEAAGMNHMPSEFILGAMAYDRLDYDSTEKHYSKAADAGYEPAIEFLAKFWMKDLYGHRANYNKARELMLKLKSPTDPKILYELAECYNKGYGGVEIDTLKAFNLYKQSADKDYYKAFLKIAEFYDSGKIVKKNSSTALMYRLKAQKQSSNMSMKALSASYKKDTGNKMTTTKEALAVVQALRQ